MKIFTVVGARPNFIKIDPELKQEIIHTGQHYSYRMSQIFFEERHLPDPIKNLGCKGDEVGRMIDLLRKLFRKEKPNIVIVFGDAHSSLAGALAAAYEKVPVAHIEAGLRSGKMDMPEEINRIIIDRISAVRFCPNYSAQNNLMKEGIVQDIFVVGDPAFDAMNDFLPIKRKKNFGTYIILTIHREANAENKSILRNIFEAIRESKERFIFPVHPRTRLNLKRFKIKMPQNVKTVSPRSYKEMLSLISNSKKILTDSGGVQREAYWMQKPVIILRTETEWPEILQNNAGMLALEKNDVLYGINEFKGSIVPPPVYGANKKIREQLYHYL